MALDRRRTSNQPQNKSELTENTLIFCHVCGFEAAIEVHCKIICRNCGYTRDCSDP